MTTDSLTPIARTEGLLVETTSDDTIVYDVDRDLAHCLDAASARVWTLCDGAHAISEIATATGLTVPSVYATLAELAERHLLVGPTPAAPDGISRRAVLRRLALSGAAVAAVPTIITLKASPAGKLSCLPNGEPCATHVQCCSAFCQAGVCGGGT